MEIKTKETKQKMNTFRDNSLHLICIISTKEKINLKNKLKEKQDIIRLSLPKISIHRWKSINKILVISSN